MKKRKSILCVCMVAGVSVAAPWILAYPINYQRDYYCATNTHICAYYYPQSCCVVIRASPNDLVVVPTNYMNDCDSSNGSCCVTEIAPPNMVTCSGDNPWWAPAYTCNSGPLD